MHPSTTFIRLLIIFVCGVFTYHPASAGYVDFEGFVDNDILSTQIPGITFNDATVLTAGVSLNEFDFPPHSGGNVIAALDGTLAIGFDTPMNLVSGYISFADATGVNLSVFDINNLLLAEASYDVPATPDSVVSNLFIALGTSGIRSMVVTLNGNISDSTFIFDDLSYVPEPPTALLILIGLFGYKMPKTTKTHPK